MTPTLFPSREIIGTLPLGTDDIVIELARSDCQVNDCALSIASNRGAGRRALALDVRVPRGAVAAVTEPPEPGAFVLGQANAGVWSIGEEEASAPLSVTPAGSERSGLFVLSAEMGFEHLKSRHAIIELTNEGWTSLWSRPDPQGPHATAVAATGTAGHFVYLDAFFEPDAAQPDALTAVELVYRGPGTPLVEQAPSVPILALPIREFGTPAEARAARDPACHAEALVLPSARLEPAAARRGVSLVEVGLETRLLAAEAARIVRCTGHEVGEVRALVDVSSVEER